MSRILFESLHRRGLLMSQALLIGLCLLGGTFLLHPWSWFSSAVSGAASALQPAPEEFDPSALESALFQLGYEPDSLATVGASTATTEAIIEDAKVWWEENAQALQEAKQTAAEASFAAVLAQRALLRGTGEATPESVAAAQVEFTQAQDTAGELLASLDESLEDHLTQAQTLQLDTIAANRDWGLEPEFGILTMTEEEWLATKDAVAAEAAEVEPEAGDAQVLAEIQSDPAFTLAETNHDTLDATVTNAWEEAMQEE